MRFVSTRKGDAVPSIDGAILRGLAADGGLFVPEDFPGTMASDSLADASLSELAATILAPFFSRSALRERLPAICRSVFDFPAPLVRMSIDRQEFELLELFHGPTSAFKDFGARFLMRCLDALTDGAETGPTILAATSGDTGGAVAAAAAGSGLSACVLFPNGGVSDLQERQLCCWPKNILSLRVAGDFDACQALVKRAFADADLRRRRPLSSANSINIARLLAQTTYFWQASLRHRRDRGSAPGFVIPTGNLGNALACIWAKRMGAPISRVHVAVNANRTLADYGETGHFEPRPSVKTISNAMDVGAPSNIERLTAMLGVNAPGAIDITFSAHSDAETAQTIRAAYEQSGRIICPHTAVGVSAVKSGALADPGKGLIVAATAHPAKFNDVIGSVLGVTADYPPQLAALPSTPTSVTDIRADYEQLREQILSLGAGSP